MKVRMADHYGMCFGVRDAIEMAINLTEREPLTILGDLVHNPDVVSRIDAAGARRAQIQDPIETHSVLLTAHGTSDRVRLQLRANGYQVHDATCPLVERAHRALGNLVAQGYYPIIIGKPDHVEVQGLVGDFDPHFILFEEKDLDRLAHQLHGTSHNRLGVVAQTTCPLERARELVDALEARFPTLEIRFVDTVCQPTKDRQQALRDLAKASDVIVVVGGEGSNNSRKLAELATRLGCPAHRVSDASELRPEWFEGHEVVGVTAGTSTPEDVIDQVRQWLVAH